MRRTNILFISLLIVCTVSRSFAEEDEEENDQIVGGTTALKGQYPFVAHFRNGLSAPILCSGSLIASNKILTSAGCARKLAPRATLAILNTLSVIPDADRVIRFVVGIAIPPDYNPATTMHDIAVLTLDVPVAPTSVLPIAIGYNQQLAVGQVGLALGWGFAGSAPVTTILRRAPVTLQAPAVCSNSYRIPALSQGFHVCLAAPGVAACTVDQGGPVLLSGMLMGVNSLSRCGGGDPFVAVRAQSYRTWIQQQLVG